MADTRTSSRTAGLLALAYTLAVAGLALRGIVHEREADVLLLALFFIPWQAAPVVAAACAVSASAGRAGAAAFLAIEILLVLSMAWLEQDVYRNGNSTAPVSLVIWPLVQWGALLLFFPITYLFGWRMRENWPDPEAP